MKSKTSLNPSLKGSFCFLDEGYIFFIKTCLFYKQIRQFLNWICPDLNWVFRLLNRVWRRLNWICRYWIGSVSSWKTKVCKGYRLFWFFYSSLLIRFRFFFFGFTSSAEGNYFPCVIIHGRIILCMKDARVFSRIWK